MRKCIPYILVSLILIVFTSSKKSKPVLKNVFKSHFYIGAAVSTKIIQDGDYDGGLLLQKHFSSITPENDLKWERIHPAPGQFKFDIADKFVKIGERDSMFIVGHTLVWHSQLPKWVESIHAPDQLDKTMQEHITSIMERYKGRIHAWDVLNEALNEDGSLRNSVFYNVLGEDYIKKAFTYAHETDPDCELYYNDYNLVNKEKREGAIRLVKDLQAAGVKIDGIGMQGHWNLHWPSLEDIEQSILDYASLGVKVMITELDITVLPNPWDLEGADVNQSFENNEMMNPYPNFLPDSVNILLAKRYEDIFKILLKHKEKISRITFWGIHDDASWLNDWPIKGRTNYPLLFDSNYRPKKAFKAIMRVGEKEIKP